MYSSQFPPQPRTRLTVARKPPRARSTVATRRPSTAARQVAIAAAGPCGERETTRQPVARAAPRRTVTMAARPGGRAACR